MLVSLAIPSNQSVLIKEKCLIKSIASAKLPFLELHHISSVNHLFDNAATKNFVLAFVLSRLDYCNYLLAGLHLYMIKTTALPKLYSKINPENTQI